MKQKINGCIYDHVWQVFLRFMNELKIITFFWEFEFFANSNSILSTSIWIINTLNLWSEKVIYENFFLYYFFALLMAFIFRISLSLFHFLSLSLSTLGWRSWKIQPFNLIAQLTKFQSFFFSLLSELWFSKAITLIHLC